MLPKSGSPLRKVASPKSKTCCKNASMSAATVPAAGLAPAGPVPPLAAAAPAQFEVTLSGIVNNNCTNCGSYNGTWIVTQLQDYPCTYRGTLPKFCGNMEQDVPYDSWIDVQIHGGGIAVTLRIDAITYAEFFRAGYPSPCCQINEQIPRSYAVSSAHCNTTNATCSLKSL